MLGVRPTLGVLSGTRGFKRTNLSLDDESLKIAERIHSNRTAAVRIALAFWAEHHPPPKGKK